MSEVIRERMIVVRCPHHPEEWKRVKQSTFRIGDLKCMKRVRPSHLCPKCGDVPYWELDGKIHRKCGSEVKSPPMKKICGALLRP
jgi:hypothetical protein